MKRLWQPVLAAGCVALADLAVLMTSGLSADDAPPPVGPPAGQVCPLSGPMCPPGGQACPDKPRRWTPRWWDQEAQSPPGARQRKVFGKLWPPFPRPTGPEQPCVHKYHSAHYWPFPYTCDDRGYVRDLSAREVDAGWTTATTLYDYHFDDAHEVNAAGRLHLRWIVETAPVIRRLVYVQSTFAPESNELRLASVRQELADMLGPEPPPPVMLRVASPYGRPAIEIDLIRRSERDNLPVPHIPYSSGSSGSGSGGGGGGGSGGGGAAPGM